MTQKGKIMTKKKKHDKLAQDAAAAKAANMSYGQWKATQTIPVVITKGIPDGWLECQYCGKPFKPTMKRRQFYCEAYCGRMAQQERERIKRQEQKNKA